MFNVVGVKNYDKRHSYGTDWVTEYECRTDEEVNDITALITKVREAGHYVCGECHFIRKDSGTVVLKTVCY